MTITRGKENRCPATLRRRPRRVRTHPSRRRRTRSPPGSRRVGPAPGHQLPIDQRDPLLKCEVGHCCFLLSVLIAGTSGDDSDQLRRVPPGPVLNRPSIFADGHEIDRGRSVTGHATVANRRGVSLTRLAGFRGGLLFGGDAGFQLRQQILPPDSVAATGVALAAFACNHFCHRRCVLSRYRFGSNGATNSSTSWAAISSCTRIRRDLTLQHSGSRRPQRSAQIRL